MKFVRGCGSDQGPITSSLAEKVFDEADRIQYNLVNAGAMSMAVSRNGGPMVSSLVTRVVETASLARRLEVALVGTALMPCPSTQWR